MVSREGWPCRSLGTAPLQKPSGLDVGFLWKGAQTHPSHPSPSGETDESDVTEQLTEGMYSFLKITHIFSASREHSSTSQNDFHYTKIKWVNLMPAPLPWSRGRVATPCRVEAGGETSEKANREERMPTQQGCGHSPIPADTARQLSARSQALPSSCTLAHWH